jgi:hypothetical protein
MVISSEGKSQPKSTMVEGFWIISQGFKMDFAKSKLHLFSRLYLQSSAIFFHCHCHEYLIQHQMSFALKIL